MNKIILTCIFLLIFLFNSIGLTYENDDLQSVRGEDYYELNRVDGTLKYAETRKDVVKEKYTIGKCKKHEKLF